MRVADELRAPGREGGREGMKGHMVQYSVIEVLAEILYVHYNMCGSPYEDSGKGDEVTE